MSGTVVLCDGLGSVDSSSGGQIQAPGLARLKPELGTGKELVSSMQACGGGDRGDSAASHGDSVG